MPQESKIFGGLVMGSSRQHRTIIKAASRAAARRVLIASGRHCSVAYFRDYWTETGNAKELAVMADKPDGTILYACKVVAYLPWEEAKHLPEAS